MNGKRKPRGAKTAQTPKRNKLSSDPFFADDEFHKKKNNRKNKLNDEEIASSDDDDVELSDGGLRNGVVEEREEFETADEVRKRLAQDVLARVKEGVRRERGFGDESGSDEEDEEVAKRMMKDQMEDSGRLRRMLASRYGL